jgi:hypothetical protein
MIGVYMNKIGTIYIILITILLIGIVSACSVNITSENIELRSTGSYDSSIVAEDNDEIDIKIEFDIDDVAGNDCSNDIEVKAIIYRWDDDDDEWDLYKTTSTKKQNRDDNKQRDYRKKILHNSSFLTNTEI